MIKVKLIKNPDIIPTNPTAKIKIKWCSFIPTWKGEVCLAHECYLNREEWVLEEWTLEQLKEHCKGCMYFKEVE